MLTYACQALLLGVLESARALLDPLTYTTMILPALNLARRLRKDIDTRISFIAGSSYNRYGNKDAATSNSLSEGVAVFRSFKEVVSGLDSSDMVWRDSLLTISGENSDQSSEYSICDAMPMNLFDKGRVRLDIDISA